MAKDIREVSEEEALRTSTQLLQRATHPVRSQLPTKSKGRGPHVVVDIGVLVAGIAGFREPFAPGWLVTEDLLDEYEDVFERLGVRRNLMGRVISLVRQRAEDIKLRAVWRLNNTLRSSKALQRRTCR